MKILCQAIESIIFQMNNMLIKAKSAFINLLHFNPMHLDLSNVVSEDDPSNIMDADTRKEHYLMESNYEMFWDEPH